MYDLRLTAEQLEFRDTIRDFVTQEIKPVAIKSERLEPFERPLLVDLLDTASQMGLRSMALSEEKGGAGVDSLTSCIVTEELAAGDVDLAAVLAETSCLSHLLFDRLMTPAQREHFLPAFVADDSYHLARAIREPATDTRLGIDYHRKTRTANAVATKATRADAGFVINGTKVAVANAPVAKLFVVQVLLDGAGKTGWLLIPRDTAGLSVRETPGVKRGYHGTGGDVTFANCRVPADNLIGVTEADALLGDADGKLHDLAIALGIGRAAYEAAVEYAGLRVQGGRNIIEHQGIGSRLADVAIGLEVARGAVWRAAFAADHPEAVADRSLPNLPLSAIARVFTTATVYRGAKDSAEIFGAMGVMRDMPLHKYIHDAFISLHAGNGNTDGKLHVAEALAGFRR